MARDTPPVIYLKKTSKDSPAAALPPEILSLIFEMAFKSTDDERIPDILCDVSHTWRNVAISNPHLWTRLTISLPLDVGAVAMKLKRSKESLLDICIIVPYLEYEAFVDAGFSLPTLAEYQDLSNELSPSYHRCRKLCIMGTFYAAQAIVDLILEPLRKISMPYLEEFTLNGENGDPDPVAKIDLFPDAPKLRDVRLGGYGLLYYRPPIHHITTLHLVALTRARYALDFFTTFLPSIPSLAFLALYEELIDGSFANYPTKCSVPNLESLFILGPNTSAIAEILLFLSAPKLRELVISPLSAKDLMTLHHVQDSALPLFPNLLSLTITPLRSSAPIRLDVDELPSRCFPGLKRLVLTNPGYNFFERLFGDSKAQLFQDLRELAVSNVDEEFLSVMDRVIERRGAWITTLYMDTPSLQEIDPSRRKWNPYGSKTPNILVEANIWEEQRQRAMYIDEELRFTS